MYRAKREEVSVVKNELNLYRNKKKNELQNELYFKKERSEQIRGQLAVSG